MRHALAAVLAAAALLLAVPLPVAGQQTPRPASGRVSFFTNASNTAADSRSRSFSELIGTATFESPSGDEVHYEYRADIRFAGYPSSNDRSRRVSIYDAYVGRRFASGRVGVRAGQMWLNELGGLGAVGGGLFEIGQRRREKHGRWRGVAFAGLEPKILEAGYVTNVMKAGGFAAFEGAGLRRHVVGVVALRNQGVMERSVVVMNNMLPVGRKLFVYQAAEYDVKSAGIESPGSLTYFFGNARVTATHFLEFQGSYHRGRSIDSRTIVRDQVDGRAVDPRLLDGLRFESANGRVTLTLRPGVRVFGGYGRDRNNHDEAASTRFTYGIFASDVAATGLDVAASDSRMQRPGGNSYNSWYVSLGRSIGRNVYLSGDYGSSLSLVRFISASGFIIENRPHSRRLAVSSLFNLTRVASLLASVERLTDGASTQTRLMSGINYRF